MPSPPQSATSAAPPSAADSFTARVPYGLRKEADQMDWDKFRSTYATTGGPLRLGQWTCTDKECSATRLGPQPRNYHPGDR